MTSAFFWQNSVSLCPASVLYSKAKFACYCSYLLVSLSLIGKDLSDLKKKKNVLFIIGDWNANVGSQEIPRVTSNFGFEVQNEAGQRLTEFCQENTLVIANTLF